MAESDLRELIKAATLRADAASRAYFAGHGSASAWGAAEDEVARLRALLNHEGAADDQA